MLSTRCFPEGEQGRREHWRQLTPLQALQEKDETDLKILCEKDGGAASGVLAYRRPM